MKLLIFIHSLSGGGAERVTANLANYWAASGWRVTIVTLAPIENDFYQLHHSIQRISLDLATDSRNVLLGIVHNLRRIHALRQLILKLKPEAALAMMTTANILLALASIGIKDCRAIGSERIHPPQLPISEFWRFLRRYSYALLDCVVVLSSETQQWLTSHTKVRHTVIIPNPVIYPLAQQPPLLRLDALLNPQRNYLLAVGRLSAQKNFELLLKVFAELANTNLDWDLIILGEGELRSALETQIIQLSLQQRVHMPGRAGNVGDWYQRVDLYVLTSDFEGFPNTLLEAMAYGLPCVSFDCDTGPRDIIQHGINGILVPAENATLLIKALDKLMNNAALRQTYATKAKEVQLTFNISQLVQMWAGVLSGNR